MKKYIGIKKIEAEPMTRGAYNNYRGWTVPDNENPADEGYIVKYPDGYISWSPKNIFEEAYSEIGNNLLMDTAILMKSKDYKERFKAEYQQLAVRYKKLKAMLEKWDNGELPFKPTCPRELYQIQSTAMLNYLEVLEERANIEKVELSEG